MNSWQIVLVAVVVGAAWFVDVRLAAILAGVAAATGVMAHFHMRSRARRNATTPLIARVDEVLGAPATRGETDREGEDAEAPSLRRETHIGGRPVTIEVVAHADAKGRLIGCVDLRTPVVRPVPFCFAAQLREPPIRLSPLVANAAVFESRMECELETVPTADTGLADDWDLMSSSAGAMHQLLRGPLADALARWQEGALADEVELAVLSFDGATLRLLLVPRRHEGSAWVRPALRGATSLAGALAAGLVSLGGGAG